MIDSPVRRCRECSCSMLRDAPGHARAGVVPVQPAAWFQNLCLFINSCK